MVIKFVPRSEFDRILSASGDGSLRLAALADLCRLNALAAVKRAGSGHLGSSFSSLDIVTHLYFAEMNVREKGPEDPGRDIYFSSKGHDCPGLYAVLHALGILGEDQLLRLRRRGGPSGHPDVSTPGVEANTGSLGMGLSKAKGFAWAKRRLGRGGRVFVLLGDGELQEGQIYEALTSAPNQGLSALTAIVDCNEVQSDKRVREVGDLRDLEEKFRAFGWRAARCDGHDFAALARVFEELRRETDRPKILVADTVKGRGVSFMEHPRALREGGGFYRWHAGAPDDAAYEAARAEILARATEYLGRLGLPPPELRTAADEGQAAPSGALGEPASAGGQTVLPPREEREYVAEAYGRALEAAVAARPEVVVLDADLAADCRIRGVEIKFPDRFIEEGIAEQDMVSMAGALARSGLLPVVNSFAAFLAARANEQIYNNACEGARVVYAGHYAGLVPAGPGASHQSLRDIALVGSVAGIEILQPSCAGEAEAAVAYALGEAPGSVYLRLNIGPSPRTITLPADYRLKRGRGALLRNGGDAAVFAYGPAMLHEALKAAEILADGGRMVRVIAHPWLNRVDLAWAAEAVSGCRAVFVLEDHAPIGGLGDRFREALGREGLLDGRTFEVFGVEGLPTWGAPEEALDAHRLGGVSLVARIRETMA